MTIEEFDKQGFRAGDKALYKGNVYDVATVDFEERLIGLIMHISGGEPYDVSWVRCENVEYIASDRFDEVSLSKTIIQVLDVKAKAGCDNPSWIGYCNGNGTEIGADIERLIKRAKRLLDNY